MAARLVHMSVLSCRLEWKGSLGEDITFRRIYLKIKLICLVI